MTTMCLACGLLRVSRLVACSGCLVLPSQTPPNSWIINCGDFRLRVILDSLEAR